MSGILASPVDELSSCSEITSAHAKEAASSSSALRAFFMQIEKIARPKDGAVNLFLVLARLAETRWMEGHVRIELKPIDDVTSLVIIDDLGLGIRERILPPTRLNVPFTEFSEGLDRYPGIVLPLGIAEEGGTLVLVPLMARSEDLEDRALSDIEIAPEPRQSERPTKPPVGSQEIPEEAISPDAAQFTRPTIPMPADTADLAIAEANRPKDPRREDDG